MVARETCIVTANGQEAMDASEAEMNEQKKMLPFYCVTLYLPRDLWAEVHVSRP